ncbi:MAG: hypothetical protein HC881_12075 [Leptolyngbyaceae cyanobacterium SL_7_1]|nr:hypothetical protein [Leptolyngbyaceae cyanobacterium SL_7_1]
MPSVRITKIMADDRLFPGSLQRLSGSCRFLAILSSLALLAGLTSCRQLQQLQVGQLSLEQLNLEQLNSAASVGLDITVSAADQAGVFDLSGKTSLPDRTTLVVLAVRYLNPAEPASIALNPESTYSILAYQPVEVRQGSWQTQLNLWEVSANGQYQEAWQREQTKLGVTFDPTDDVVFFGDADPGQRIAPIRTTIGTATATTCQPDHSKHVGWATLCPSSSSDRRWATHRQHCSATIATGR